MLADAYGDDMAVISPHSTAGNAGEELGPLRVAHGTSGRVYQMLQTARIVASGRLADTFPMYGHPYLAVGARVMRKQYGLFVHGGEMSSSWLGRLAFRWLVDGAELIVAGSSATRDRWLKDCRAPVVVIRPGINRIAMGGDNALPNCRQDGSNIDVIIVARLVRRKNVAQTVTAMCKVADRLTNMSLTIHVVGDGPCRDEVDRCAEGRSDVVVHGFVSDDELNGLYRKCDLFVLCASEIPGNEGWEGFGIVYLEAAAWGLSVIAMESGGVGEACSNDGSVMVPAGEWGAFQAEFEKLLLDGARRERMGRANLIWAAENDWGARAELLDQSVRSVLGEGRVERVQ